jgi:F0F1-type ATP synthase membrane subunit c/vacuolar-type H+-ATPase subunit K
MSKQLTAAIPAGHQHYDGTLHAGAVEGLLADAIATAPARRPGLSRGESAAFLLVIAVVELAWITCLLYAFARLLLLIL